MKTRLLPALVILSLALGGLLAASNGPSAGASMTAAAEAFLKSLSEDQKKSVMKPFDDASRVGWHFIPKTDRKGIQARDMTDAQRELAYKLLQAALSDAGYSKARRIMAREVILKDLEKSKKGGNIRDNLRYYWTIFGTPAPASKWGLSVEGHHLSQNFVVENGKVGSFTPCFFGSNPATMKADFGDVKKGDRIQSDQEDLGFELLGKLNAEQRKIAVVDDKAPKEIRGAGEPQPPAEMPAGLSGAKMVADQQAVLSKLIDSYLVNLPKELADAAGKEIAAEGLAKVGFCWAGADKPGIGHYYRVQGSTFLIEFINNQADSAGNPANHIHAVWRDMRGDFAIHR